MLSAYQGLLVCKSCTMSCCLVQALPVSVQKLTAQKGTAASEAKKQQACAKQEQDNQLRDGNQDTHTVTDGDNQVHFATYQF